MWPGPLPLPNNILWFIRKESILVISVFAEPDSESGICGLHETNNHQSRWPELTLCVSQIWRTGSNLSPAPTPTHHFLVFSQDPPTASPADCKSRHTIQRRPQPPWLRWLTAGSQKRPEFPGSAEGGFLAKLWREAAPAQPPAELHPDALLYSHSHLGLWVLEAMHEMAISYGIVSQKNFTELCSWKIHRRWGWGGLEASRENANKMK